MQTTATATQLPYSITLKQSLTSIMLLNMYKKIKQAKSVIEHARIRKAGCEDTVQLMKHTLFCSQWSLLC